MRDKKKKIEDILVQGLTHILKRINKVNAGDQLAIAQEYKEWINCVSADDFTRQEILILENIQLNK